MSYNGVPNVAVNCDELTIESSRLTEAHSALGEHGIAAGRQGYDLSTLAAAVYDKNWSYGIDLATGSYQAVIRTERQSNQPANRVRHELISAYGDTPESALAFALVEAIDRSVEK